MENVKICMFAVIKITNALCAHRCLQAWCTHIQAHKHVDMGTQNTASTKDVKIFIDIWTQVYICCMFAKICMQTPKCTHTNTGTILERSKNWDTEYCNYSNSGTHWFYISVMQLKYANMTSPQCRIWSEYSFRSSLTLDYTVRSALSVPILRPLIVHKYTKIYT